MISPINKGDQPLMHNAFTVDSGAVFSLAGLSTSALSLHMVDPSGNFRAGTGTWSITNASAGLADYQWSAADSTTAGVWEVYPVVTLATGPRTFDPQKIQITNLP